MKKRQLNSFLLLGLTLLPIITFALTTDEKQPTDFQADSVSINRKTGVGVYRGHVQLTRGTTIVKGDLMVVQFDKDNKLEKATITGQPASYQTLTDPKKPLLILIGNTINYYPERGFAAAIGDAKVTQGNNSFAGPKINFDIKNKVVNTPVQTKITVDPNQK